MTQSNEVSVLRNGLRKALELEHSKAKRKAIRKEWEAKIKEAQERQAEIEVAESYELREVGQSKSETKRERRQARKKKESKSLIERLSEIDESTKEAYELAELVGKEHRQIMLISADGNCLYSAIADQLELTRGEEATYTRMRCMAGNWMKANKDAVLPFLDEKYHTQEGFEDYLGDVYFSNEYGGELEIRALSESLQAPIQIYTRKGIIDYGTNFPGEPLRISFHEHLYSTPHYNSIYPI